MRNLFNFNISLLKSFFFIALISFSVTAHGQQKSNVFKKLFKKNKVQLNEGESKLDSVKTIYQMVKRKLKKNKAKKQEVDDLTNWYHNEIKKITDAYNLPPDMPKKVKRNKPGKKKLENKEVIKTKNVAKKPLPEKPVYTDTLYFLQPVNKTTSYQNNKNEVAPGLTLPFRNEINKPKYFSDIEIGEHVDHFAFNQWEIPTQPDEFIKKKIERYPTILPLVFNDDVKRQVKDLTTSNHYRKWLQEILGKMNFFFPMYEQVLDQYGIPNEVKFLSVIESGLNPKATSPMGAKGLWQFMPGTAKQYKLKNNSLIDEARDPKKATRAACEYLNDMYSEFHDWFLSLAAYNCGPGNVRKAIRRAKDGPKDYWGVQKYLPRETRNYVPKFIAVIYILNNYEAHNLKPQALDYDLQKIDTIHLHQQINTNDLVKYCGIKKEHIKFLNPILRTNHTPPPNPTFVLKIPYSKLENVLYYRDEIMPRPQTVAKNTLPNHGTANLSGEFVHTIKRGENLDGISKKYGVTVSELKSWNGLKTHIIREGQNLYIYK